MKRLGWYLTIMLAALTSAVTATLGYQRWGLDFMLFPGVVLGLHVFLLSAWRIELDLAQATRHLFVSIALISAGWHVAVRLYLMAFRELSALSGLPVQLTDVSGPALVLAALSGLAAGLPGGLAVGGALLTATPSRLYWPIIWRAMLMGALAGATAIVAHQAVTGLNLGSFMAAVVLFFVWQSLVLLSLYSVVESD